VEAPCHNLELLERQSPQPVVKWFGGTQAHMRTGAIWCCRVGLM
jgi:hypothetical protein